MNVSGRFDKRFDIPLNSQGNLMQSSNRVFVPSVKEDDGNTIGLGCFSTEEIAWDVLRAFIKKSEQMNLDSCSVAFGKLT